jgi:hypothetical protein
MSSKHGAGIVRLPSAQDGAIGPRETFGPSGWARADSRTALLRCRRQSLGDACDVRCAVRHQRPRATIREILADTDPARVALLQTAFEAGTLTQDLMLDCARDDFALVLQPHLRGPDSGPSSSAACAATRIPCFRSPVPGLRPRIGATAGATNISHGGMLMRKVIHYLRRGRVLPTRRQCRHICRSHRMK